MMKKVVFLGLLLACLSVSAQKLKTENVILVTFDGYRWQEVFTGADKQLIEDTAQVKDVAATKKQYWANTADERRKLLMPFFWNTIDTKGLLFGDRAIGCSMKLKNLYKFSYPGYNEIFSGHKDIRVGNNNYGDNPNRNIFDFLSADSAFTHKMVAVANWDAFPKIINAHRNKVPVFVDFKCTGTGASCDNICFGSWTTNCPNASPNGMKDTITYHFAKQYLQNYHPRFAFIGFDETDHYGHEGNYDAYLNAANMLDRYMQDLWSMIQSDPQYKDKTTLIITCDHGRGDANKKSWHHHGVNIFHSNQTWMAVMGPDTPAKGEKVGKKRYRTNQIAATIAQLFGKKYKQRHHTGKPIDIIAKL